MDLDNIKKTWQETEIKSSVGEDKIRKMLNNTGKSALERLIKYEKIFLWTMIPCILAGVLFYHMHDVTGIIYFALLVVNFFWQIYKIRFLKRIDVSSMNVMEVSKSITRYRQYLNYELIGGSIFIVIFFSSYIFYALPNGLSLLSIRHGYYISFFELILSFALLLVLSASLYY